MSRLGIRIKCNHRTTFSPSTARPPALIARLAWHGASRGLSTWAGLDIEGTVKGSIRVAVVVAVRSRLGSWVAWTDWVAGPVGWLGSSRDPHYGCLGGREFVRAHMHSDAQEDTSTSTAFFGSLHIYLL